MALHRTVLDVRVVSGSGGGPEKTILNSPSLLDGSGYRMLCAYLRHPDDHAFDSIRQLARSLQAPLVEIDDFGPLDLILLNRLYRICRDEHVAVWHGHDYKSNLLGLLLSPCWPMRLVTTVHGWVHRTWRTPLYYFIDRLCLPKYEQVYCVSEDLYNACLGVGVSASRAITLENGIDSDRFRRCRSPAEAKSLLNLPSDRRFVGAVGRLSLEKGFHHLIHALSALIHQGHQVSLLVVGEGPARTDLLSLANQLEVHPYVHFVGHHSDVRPFFEAMDIFALASIREGLPNVVLEAMAMSVPVVATRVGGLSQVIADGQNGLLVQPGEVSSLTLALASLLEDNMRSDRLAAAALLTILERYNFSHRMKRLIAYYDQLFDSRSSPYSAGEVLG